MTRVQTRRLNEGLDLLQETAIWVLMTLRWPPYEIFTQADPHPDSPAACGTSPEEHFGYLKRLSGNGHYRELLDMVGAEVCLPCIIVDRLLTHHSDKLWTHRWFSLVGFLVLP